MKKKLCFQETKKRERKKSKTKKFTVHGSSSIILFHLQRMIIIWSNKWSNLEKFFIIFFPISNQIRFALKSAISFLILTTSKEAASKIIPLKKIKIKTNKIKFGKNNNKKKQQNLHKINETNSGGWRGERCCGVL